jgi:hypothetical protein
VFLALHVKLTYRKPRNFGLLPESSRMRILRTSNLLDSSNIMQMTLSRANGRYPPPLSVAPPIQPSVNYLAMNTTHFGNVLALGLRI